MPRKLALEGFPCSSGQVVTWQRSKVWVNSLVLNTSSEAVRCTVPFVTVIKGVKKTVRIVVSASQVETTEVISRSFGEQREYEAREKQVESRRRAGRPAATRTPMIRRRSSVESSCITWMS